MPEFMDTDGRMPPNSGATTRCQRKRRRNPIAGNVKIHSRTSSGTSIGPCDTCDCAQLQNDTANDAEGCKKYSTDLVDCECRREHEERRKFAKKQKNINTNHRNQRPVSHDQNNSGKNCGFLKRLIRALWPFGQKRNDNCCNSSKRCNRKKHHWRGHGH
jgi:hypothetical protein